MNLDKNKIKELIVKLHQDLNLEFDSKYPVLAQFYTKDSELSDYPFDHWLACFDYSNPEDLGDNWFPGYTEYNITINDETGEIDEYGHYTG